jgi:hypothetical protein
MDISDINLDNLITDDEWVNALARILDESMNASPSERSQIITFLTRFVQKSPLRLSPLDDIAVRLQANLTLANLTQRLNELSSRNQELVNLADSLGVQVIAANQDAGKLTRITGEIKKVTASITTIKDLVSQLNSTDATKVSRIEAVITALENLNQIL